MWVVIVERYSDPDEHRKCFGPFSSENAADVFANRLQRSNEDFWVIVEGLYPVRSVREELVSDGWLDA